VRSRTRSRRCGLTAMVRLGMTNGNRDRWSSCQWKADAGSPALLSRGGRSDAERVTRTR
jgi:hypothetical protein